MATVLGKDQIAKVNFAYRGIYAHIKTLIHDASEGIELMNAHVLAEYLDTDELSRLFRDLGFLSPAQKRALVRAAIFDVSLGRELTPVEEPNTDNGGARRVEPAAPLKEFTPGQFKLNVATTTSLKEATSPQLPQVKTTPSALNVIPAMKAQAAEEFRVADEARQSRVEEIRQEPA